MDYTSEKFLEKTYHIKTTLDGKQVEFNVVVAKDESEIPDLVAFHLNSIKNPPPLPQASVQPQPTVADLQETIKELADRLNKLEGKKA